MEQKETLFSSNSLLFGLFQLSRFFDQSNGCLNIFIGQLKLDSRLEFYFECRDRY